MPRNIEPAPVAPNLQPQEGEEDGFVTVENVPIFDEHETDEVDDAGKLQRIKYTREVLEQIAEGMNAKIRDTGDYVMLTDGHTPDPDDPKSATYKPDILGMAGPFTVGEIGREKPRACILGRFRYFKDKSKQAMRLPRRSVEIWKEPNLGDRTIDPIALLGAEAPRRSLGMVYEKYSRQRTSQRSGRPVAVARYSTAFPGGGNTFVPGHDDRKTKHAKESTMDAQEIIAALEQTDWVQWVKKQMQAEAATNTSVGDPNDPTAAGAPPAGPPAAAPKAAMQKYMEAGDVDGANAHMEGQPQEMRDKMRAHYEAAADDKEKEFFSKCSAKYGSAAWEKGEEKEEKGLEKYRKETSDLRVKYAKLNADFEALKAREVAAEKKALRAERYSKLTEFRQAGVCLDPEKEIEDVQDMTEAQWERHQTRIVEHYQKAPMGVVLPSIKNATKGGNDIQSRVEKCNKAEALAKSKNIPFRQAYAEIN